MVQINTIAAVSALLSTAALFVSAQTNETMYPEPITIGQYGFPHGHLIVGWTPTKTTMNDVCAGTRTFIQSVQTGYYSNPLCGFPFEIDGYSNLTLQCADGTDTLASQVTAIATNGVETHVCTKLELSIFSTYCGGGASLVQQYACQ
ncbi:hypothetical protein B0T17DRAFT_617115 [Bombardia bombarda]|uniref:Uncharacterized protein n=1 Tax=Bombardia bombarda TaxID=252184 RepID=A0AA40C5F8_9PEZI|nr:hypothetical protein B0T17DRAFT_617115 [Bombardia bombarda]